MALGLAAILLTGMIAVIVVVIVAAVRTLNSQKRKALSLGYASLGDYLRAAPRTDEEKRDAVDLALKGLVICALGLVFPPFLLIGLFPLFYGGRKLIYASMGLGLVDDVDQPGA